MSDLLFWCPKCNGSLAADGADIGAEFECSTCGAKSIVPMPTHDVLCMSCGNDLQVAAPETGEPELDCPACGKPLASSCFRRKLALKRDSAGGSAVNTPRGQPPDGGAAAVDWQQLTAQRQQRVHKSAVTAKLQRALNAAVWLVIAAVVAAGGCSLRAWMYSREGDYRGLRASLMTVYVLQEIEKGNREGGGAGADVIRKLGTNTAATAVLADVDLSGVCRSCAGKREVAQACTDCPVPIDCPVCSSTRQCAGCKGTGQSTTPCATCKAAGTCPACDGTGLTNETRMVQTKQTYELKQLSGKTIPRERTVTVPQEVKVPCAVCGKSGRCPTCHGQRGLKDTCSRCKGTGRCQKCLTHCERCNDTRRIRVPCAQCGAEGFLFSRRVAAVKRESAMGALRDELVDLRNEYPRSRTLARVAEDLNDLNVSDALAVLDANAEVFFKTCSARKPAPAPAPAAATNAPK